MRFSQMSTATPHKRVTTVRNRRIPYLLVCWGMLSLLIAAVPAFSQESAPLFIPQSISSDRPAPQLTPTGRTSVSRPIAAPAVPVNSLETITPLTLPRLEQAALPSFQPEELDQLIREGKILESEGRWAEALTHYESALRTHRNDMALMELYLIARFHCDVGRRFHDTSYLNLMRTLTPVESLHFFEEVMNRLQEDYADPLRWEPLFRHGIRNFRIALADANFRARVNLEVSPEQLDNYLSAVQTTINGWTIRGREDMRNGILHIAEGAQKQLGLSPAIAIMEFTCGVVNSLDPNSTYLTPNQLNDQLSAIYGNLVGLGVELRSDRESLLIVRVISGSPAEEGGLKAGDRILSVDGTSTRGRDTDSAADLLQGAEGTTVRLTILSAGLGQRQREVSITRRQIEVPSVEDVRMIDDKLGYIKLTNFQSKTRLELSRALHELERQGMKCLILDLRRNPGGLFNMGVDIASMFIEQGPIVRTQGRERGLDSPCMASGETWHVPLILLIDEESASASEIVAGAIRDHERGILIGKRTYGKGTIQKVIPVPTGSARNARSGIKLTTEKFYSPQGWAYSGVGVTPHFTVKEEERTILARPLDGILPIPLPRPVTSDLDDPFIQEAVRVSKSLL